MSNISKGIQGEGSDVSGSRLKVTNLFVSAAAVVAVLLLANVPAHSQGKKDGPAPRALDGKVDLSGVWIISGSPNLPSDPAYLPEAQKLYNERKASGGKGDPEKDCLPNGVVRITSLGFRTDVALRVLEGAEVTDRGDYLVIRTPDNPEFWWGNFLLLARLPGPGQGQEWLDTFAAEFPAARHVALGVDIADDSEIPGAFAAAGLEADRATVLTVAEVRPPAQPSTEAEIPVSYTHLTLPTNREV